MLIRVRAAAIIMNEKEEVLLVYHRHPQTGEEWWTLPGGGLEDDESAVDAVVREVREECGIECVPGRLVYVREYIDWENDTHHVGLFFIAETDNYEIKTGIDPELEEQLIVEARFLSKEEIINTEVPVYPEILLDKFWEDLRRNFIGHAVYLGQQR